MKMSDLQSKKIISIVNGKSIGNIIDCDINEHGGIDALIIEQNKGLFSLNKERAILTLTLLKLTSSRSHINLHRPLYTIFSFSSFFRLLLLSNALIYQ